MLKSMRKNAKQILWPLTIVIIIGMGGYGVWYLVRPEHPAENLIGKIWGREIFLEEFQRAYLGVWIVAQMIGQPLNKKILLSMTWERILLQKETQRTGISVDRSELANLIASIPLFQTDGKFSPQIYRRILSQWQIGELEFENMMREWMGNEKLKNFVQRSTHVSPAEVEEFYQRANGKIKAEYVEIDRSAFSEAISVSGDELRNFYEQNKSRFEIPPQADIQYLLIPFRDFEDTVTFTEEDIENYYRENLSAFTSETGEAPERDEVEDRIKLELVKKGSVRAAENLAEKINTELLEANDLEQIAQKYSLALENSGSFSAADPVPGLGDNPEIAREAFGMQEGEIISYPVLIPEGFVFFKLLSKQDSRLLSLEEAEEEVRKMINEYLTEQEALQVAQDELAEIKRLLEEENISFADAAGRLELETNLTPFFTPAEPEEIPDSPEFVAAALLTPAGEISEIFPTPKGYAFLSVLETAPADPLTEEEKDRWENQTRRLKMNLVYNDWFRNLIQRAQLSVTRPEFQP